MFDIAIIGNGAAAAAALKSLLISSVGRKEKLKICVVGYISNMGYGLAYNEDNYCALMNTPACNISINSEDPLEFVKWSQKRGYYFRGYHNVPRRIYGQYLHETILQLSIKHNVMLSDSYALDVVKSDQGYLISTREHTKISAKRIILTAGQSKMNDFHDLKGFTGYIESPYPLHRQLSSLAKNRDILILGCGLTAIDILIYLYRQQHEGKIYLYSPQARLPQVKAIIKPYRPILCRYDYYYALYKKIDNPLSLRQILRPLRLELKSVYADWRKIIFSNKIETEETFKRKVEEAKQGVRWLDVLVAVQHEIDLAWGLVKQSDKDLFIKKYLPKVLKVIAPIPLRNAQIISNLFSSKRLEIVSDVDSIKKTNSGFIASRSGLSGIKVDQIVNATGLKRTISLDDDTLVSKMIKRGLLEPHPSGGVRVCPQTGQAHSDSGIFSLGQLTMGEHPLINNIEFIVMNAKAMTTALLNDFNNVRKLYLMPRVASQA